MVKLLRQYFFGILHHDYVVVDTPNTEELMQLINKIDVLPYIGIQRKQDMSVQIQFGQHLKLDILLEPRRDTTLVAFSYRSRAGITKKEAIQKVLMVFLVVIGLTLLISLILYFFKNSLAWIDYLFHNTFFINIIVYQILGMIGTTLFIASGVLEMGENGEFSDDYLKIQEKVIEIVSSKYNVTKL